MEPLVSIVIPTYNRAHSIGRTIESVLSQTYGAWEAWLIDDGSEDGTRDVVSGCLSDRRIHYIRQDNAGVSAARNHGLALAQGEYIALLDSDDMWRPWKLQLQVAAMQRFPEAVMGWTEMSATDPQGHVIEAEYLHTMYSAYRWFRHETLFESFIELEAVSQTVARLHPGKKIWTGRIFSQLLMGNLVHTSTAILVRSAVKQAGTFRSDWSFGEDYQYYMRIARQGPAIFLDVPSTLYQVGMADQLTDSRHHLQGAINYLLTVREMIDKHRLQITLPPWMLREALAEANVWIGELMLMNGDSTGAREHLLNALRYRLKGRALKDLLVAGLSERARAGLRAAYRSIRKS